MSAAPAVKARAPASFRVKVWVALMLTVAMVTAAAVVFAQSRLARAAEEELQREFASQLTALHERQAIRQTALVERCRALVRRPRILAALEDNALDLLYPSAKDELRDIVESEFNVTMGADAYALRAQFYRFLDRQGAVIVPAPEQSGGALHPAEEWQLAIAAAPARQHWGFIVRHSADGQAMLTELILMPILASETAQPIAALVLGFETVGLGEAHPQNGSRLGIWREAGLFLPGLDEATQAGLSAALAQRLQEALPADARFAWELGGTRHEVFCKLLNPGSLYPPAYEVFLYPLAAMERRQEQVRWQIIGAGMLLFLVGLAGSHFLSGRLSAPVEQLVVESARDRAHRMRAEAALESTSAELARAARFSADASHQLKTPVAVLRAGLEELLAREKGREDVSSELAALIHQTYRLSTVIDDLLLLSQMDAGRLASMTEPVDLSELLALALDDLQAHPATERLDVQTDYPAELWIAGDRHYTGLILQNLLENARKYNCAGGRIQLQVRREADAVWLQVGNTGRTIAPEAQEHIFERFHRGVVGENIPGYGLGLNLARELARLHGGELRLVRSTEGWTEFAVHFRPVAAAGPTEERG
ncbi:MAG: HAMP domain-containing sensor histidine kinase [Candidatus Didemnitutus sp.]|nr:HAMP domain-containing sensor histidine kinase [Candidatus Didemnitutus sp.]